MSSHPILLDNTALTNFALVGRADLILDLWGLDCATTTAVMAEYQAGIANRGLPNHIWQELPQLTLRPVEKDFAEKLAAQLGFGERSCIAIAVHRQGMFVSDDAKARQLARQYGVTIAGSIGILVLNIRQGNLTLLEGNAILTEMIIQGYRSPITALNTLIN